MIIINADDWGRSKEDTDRAAQVLNAGSVTSVSAMVFMEDSERAAGLAKRMGLDVGLHLNFCESWNAPSVPPELRAQHERLVTFLNRTVYAQLIYNPALRRTFRDVYRTQMQEFRRLYGAEPSHIDGHRHMHLCTNVLVDAVIDPGLKVRRSFSFEPREKGPVNRAYRRLVDSRLGSKYVITDYFFCLEQTLNGKGRPVEQVARLAKVANVEWMTHPRNPLEFDFLASRECLEVLRTLPKGTYSQLE